MQYPYRPLRIERIRAAASDLRLARDIQYCEEVESTNSLALASGQHGTVVVTDFQRAGRGRQGRGWEAPPGTSALLSLVVHLPAGVEIADLPKVVGLAVADAIEGEGVTTVLKWPNDVLIAGLKVAGILVETRRRGRGHLAAIGTGINLNWDPAAAGLASGTGVSVAAGREIDRELFIARLLRAIDLWYCCLTDAPDSLHRRWVERLGTLGQDVQIIESSGTWSGTAVGVERDGGLLVRHPDGQVRAVYAADVSVRPSQGFTKD